VSPYQLSAAAARPDHRSRPRLCAASGCVSGPAGRSSRAPSEWAIRAGRPRIGPDDFAHQLVDSAAESTTQSRTRAGQHIRAASDVLADHHWQLLRLFWPLFWLALRQSVVRYGRRHCHRRLRASDRARWPLRCCCCCRRRSATRRSVWPEWIWREFVRSARVIYGCRAWPAEKRASAGRRGDRVPISRSR
jgi:hypothetical protein